MLLLAKELTLLRVGTVSVDGTKLDANENNRNSIRYDRAGQLREQLRMEIEELLGQAEDADRETAPDPQGLPKELSRRQNLQAKMDHARAKLERRVRGRARVGISRRRGRSPRRRGRLTSRTQIVR